MAHLLHGAFLRLLPVVGGVSGDGQRLRHFNFYSSRDGATFGGGPNSLPAESRPWQVSR